MNQYQDKVVLDRFVIKNLIGRGSYGVVYKGVDTTNNNLVAIKIIGQKVIEEEPPIKFLLENEIKALNMMNCQHIVKTYGHHIDQQNVCIVLEYCNGGELMRHLQNKPGKVFSEKEAIEFFVQILAAYAHMIEQGIVHRDIKLENMMLHNGQLKIVDFGFCKLHNPLAMSTTLDKTFLGTPIYMAPEILENRARVGIKAEVFSLGVLFYIMVVGKIPFSINTLAGFVDIQALIQQIKQQNLQFNRDDKVELTQATKNLILSMLKYDEKARINIKDLIGHEIFQQLKSLRSIRSVNIANIQFPEQELKVDIDDLPNFDESIEILQLKAYSSLKNQQSYPISIQQDQLKSEVTSTISEQDLLDLTQEALSEFRRSYDFELNLLIQLSSNLQKLQGLSVCHNNSRICSEVFILKYLEYGYQQLSRALEADQNHFSLLNFANVLQLNQYKNLKQMLRQEYLPIFEANFTVWQLEYREKLSDCSFDSKHVLDALMEPQLTKDKLQYYYNLFLRLFARETQQLIGQLNNPSEQHLMQLYDAQLNAVECLNIMNMFNPIQNPSCFFEWNDRRKRAFESVEWKEEVLNLMEVLSQ